MAKPCRYQLPGQDTWMSEQELMQKLNDGLLDKFMSDNNIAVRNFKFTPNQDLASKFRTPVETAPKVEGEKITDSSKFNWGDARDFSDNVLNEKIEEAKIDLQYETNEIERARLEDRIGFAERILKERTTETKAETTPTTPKSETAPEVKEVKTPKNKKERIDAALNGDMVYHRIGDVIYESTPEQYNSALKEIAETGSISDASNIGKEISKNQAPDPVLHGYAPNLEKISQEDAKYELDERSKKAETKSETVTEIKENVIQTSAPRKKGYQNSIVKKEESTTPSGDKVTTYNTYAVDKDGKETKMTGSGIKTTVGKIAPLVKGTDGEGIFYDEDGNLKQDPNAELLITKTIEGTNQDGSYQQRVTVVGIGDLEFNGRIEADFTTNKNVVESGVSYKSNLAEETPQAEVKPISESKENVIQTSAPRKKGYQNSIVKKEESTTPSGDKVTTYNTYAVDKDGKETKMTGSGILTTVGKIAPLVKGTEGEGIFYDEDGNLKQDPNAELYITKTIEGTNQDGSYQQRVTVVGKGDLKFNGRLQSDFTTNKNVVVGESSYKSNLTTKQQQEQQITPKAETKAEATTKAEEKLSPRVEKLKNDFVESYNSIPAKNNRQRSRKYQYISSKQSSLDPEERQAAELATSEIYQQDKAAEEAKTETKAQPVAPQKTTVSKVTEKAGPKTTQGAKVKATTQRGGDLEYTVKSISEDGKTATVQAPDRLKNPNDATQGKISGEVSTLPIKENINGERVVETNKGTTVYLDRVIAPAETTLFETKKKEEAVEKKDGRGTKKSVTFALDTGRDVTRFTPKITMEKNNRTNTWELIKPDGTKMEASIELQNQAQLEYNKQNGIQEQAKEVQQETIEANKDNPEAQEFAKSDIGMNAAEAFVEPTDTQPKQKRKRTKQQANRDYQATARRGASTNVTQAFIDKLKNAFPDVSVFNDQNEFDTIANRLGRPPGTAAILYNGVIYLNPSQANVNTALEEYAHVYLLVMKSINPNLYRMGIELVRKDGKQYLDEVKNDPGYDDISNDPEAQAFEALSKMIADRGETIEDARQKSKVKEFLKDLWRGIYQFISGKSKIKENVDTLESYVDKVSRELLKNSPISNLSVSDLSKLQNKENIGNISVKSSIIERTTNRAIQFNRIFRPNRGVSQSIADRINKAQNMVKIFENRSNAVLKEFNSGMKDYYKQKDIKTDTEKLVVLRDVDRALKDSEFRNNWFSSDSEAETLIKPSVDKMRSLVDKLSTDLKNSGMLSDDLELTIDGNLDMYLNTSYMFYSPSYTGEWMDVFTPDEKDQILDYFRGQRVQPAKTIVYKVNNDGSVEATFENSFGDKIERRYDTMDSFKMALAETSRYEPATGLPGNTKLDVVALNLSDSKGKTHELDFNQGLDISSIDRFSSADSSIIGYINDQRKEIIEKKTSAESFIFGNQAVADNKTNKILERRKNMTEVQRLLLKEIQDPSTNFLNTIRKQSELLFKRGLEQEIVNSGYLARSTIQGNLTKKLNKPGSLLNGLYVTPEMHDLLTNKRLTDLNSSFFKIISIPSMIMKALVTIASPGSNAANFGSGFVQTLMTGNNPFSSDMATAMRALQEQAKISRASKGGITTEDAYGIIFNTVPTVLRGIINVANIKPKGFKEGISKLSDDQKQQYGVNSFDQLSDQDKARVILEELIENGAISPGINSGIVMDLLVASFQNKEMVQAQKTKMDMIGKALKKKFSESIDIAANVYQLSDSMFKAIVYMQEKAKRYETYGSVMKKKGMSDQEIEAEIRRMTAEVVKKQMPSYDRSPEFIKTISRVPFIGPFVQFDYQSKVNGFNILADGVKLMSDGGNMIKEGYTSEGTKLLFNGAAKVAASTATWFMSYGIVKLASYAAGGFVDGEDDETIRMILPEYRRYSPIIHLDKEANGQHAYVDIGRVDPQSLYLKYYRAFSEEGFAAGIEEILKPYITEDIFYGGLRETLSGKNKYGNADKAIENLSFGDKLMYTLNERLLPSTVFGATDRVYKSLTGVKENDVSLDPFWEFTNVFFGVKKRDINISKESGKMIHYRILKDITDVDKVNFDVKLKEFEKKEESGAKITENDRENLQEAYEELVTNSNKRVQDARDMVLRLKNLGTKEDVIRQSLEDANTPKYLINKVMADEFIPIKYDEEGDRIQYKTPKSTGRPSRPSRPKRPKRPSR